MCVWEGIKYEDVFNFLRAEGWYVNSIMKNPFDFLAVMWVSLRDHMVAQCYFGASTMSGLLRGLQALMSDIVCPMVLYMHCWAYRVKIYVIFLKFQLPALFSCFSSHDFYENTLNDMGKCNIMSSTSRDIIMIHDLLLFIHYGQSLLLPSILLRLPTQIEELHHRILSIWLKLTT